VCDAATNWAGTSCSQCAAGYLPPFCNVSSTTANGCDSAVASRFVVGAWRAGFVGFWLELATPLTTDPALLPPADCSAIFDAASTALLGGNPACMWTNRSRLYVTIGSDAALCRRGGASSATVITLAGIATAESSRPNCPRPIVGSTVTLDWPASADVVASTPAPVVAIRNTFGACEHAIVDVSATPGSTNQLIFTFTSSAASLNAALMNALTFDSVKQIASVDLSGVPSGAYPLNVTATHVITRASRSTLVTLNKTTNLAPSVTLRLAQNPLQFSASDGVLIETDAAYSPCYDSATAPRLRFTWQVIDRDGWTVPLPDTATQVEGSLVVAPRTLPAARGPYTATVRVTDDLAGESSSTSAVVVPAASAIIATLFAPTFTGGVAPATPIQLMWRCSDPDGGDVTPLVTCTGCTAVTQRALGGSGAVTAVGAMLFAGNTWADADSVAWTLTCSSSRDSRTASATSVTLVADGAQSWIRSLIVDSSADEIPSGARWSATLRSADAAATAALRSGDGISISWSCEWPCTLDLSARVVAPTGASAAMLVISEGNLVNGGLQNFSVTIASKDQPADTATYTVTVLVYQPPSGGVLIIDSHPSKVVHDLDEIRLIASGFVPGAPSLGPLRYALHMIEEDGTTTELQPFTAKATIVRRLPSYALAREAGMPSIVTFMLIVQDRLGGETEVIEPVLRMPSMLPLPTGTVVAEFDDGLRRGAQRDALALQVTVGSVNPAIALQLTLLINASVQRGAGAQVAALCVTLTSGTTSILDETTVFAIIMALNAALQDIKESYSPQAQEAAMQHVLKAAANIAAATEAVPLATPELESLRAENTMNIFHQAAKLNGQQSRQRRDRRGRHVERDHRVCEGHILHKGPRGPRDDDRCGGHLRSGCACYDEREYITVRRAGFYELLHRHGPR
jgi:hypothetical protein